MARDVLSPKIDIVFKKLFTDNEIGKKESKEEGIEIGEKRGEKS